MPEPDDRRRTLAFRAAGHHLAARLPRGELVAAIGAAGIRDVRDSGLIALHARVDGVTAADLSAQLASGEVIEVISARGTDTLVPAADVDVFTIGTTPSDEESLRARLKNRLDMLDRAGLTATEAVERTKAAAREALTDGPLDVGGLSRALTHKLPLLSEMCRGRCGSVHIVQGLFDLAGEFGFWRQERADGLRLYIAVDEPPDAGARADAARRELVRRYLACYGPSTPTHFAEWCGIGVADAARRLATAGTVEIGTRRYLLAEDRERFESPPVARGVRLLAPRDPYLLDRDRSTLVPDRGRQREIWRATPIDGVVLVDGVAAGLWRAKKSARRLAVHVTAFGALTKAAVAALRKEAAAIAVLRGCTASDVAIVT